MRQSCVQRKLFQQLLLESALTGLDDGMRVMGHKIHHTWINSFVAKKPRPIQRVKSRRYDGRRVPDVMQSRSGYEDRSIDLQCAADFACPDGDRPNMQPPLWQVIL